MSIAEIILVISVTNLLTEVLLLLFITRREIIGTVSSLFYSDNLGKRTETSRVIMCLQTNNSTININSKYTDRVLRKDDTIHILACATNVKMLSTLIVPLVLCSHSPFILPLGPIQVAWIDIGSQDLQVLVKFLISLNPGLHAHIARRKEEIVQCVSFDWW